MDLSRQSMIMSGFKPDQWPLLIIGAGGIGSNAAYVAACTGFEQIKVYEPEMVEAENIAPQFYGENDLKPVWVDGYEKRSELKTDALGRRILEMTGTQIEIASEKYIRQRETAKIVLVAVDDIRIRKRIWNQHRIDDLMFWIDGRMGGTLCSVYCVDMRNEKAKAAYAETLNAPHSPLPCGQKATASLTKGMIPGMIGTALYHITVLGGEDVPYRQMYDMSSAYHTVTWTSEVEHDPR